MNNSKIKKLNKKEFYDVYGISLLLLGGYIDKNELFVYIEPIAEKYIEITRRACCVELRHLIDQSAIGSDYVQINKKLLKALKITNFNKKRTSFSFETIIKLFDCGRWGLSYGGFAWGKIAKTALLLKEATQKRDIKKIILRIDELNDLEHNNARYLDDRCVFDLKYALDMKFNATQEEIRNECSREIKKIWRVK